MCLPERKSLLLSSHEGTSLFPSALYGVVARCASRGKSGYPQRALFPVGFWDIHTTNRDRFVPGSFQIGNSLLNKLHSCPINGFPIDPRCHIALLGCDTLVRQ